MNTKIITVSPDMSVMDAVGLLLKHSISGAPVTDAQGNLVGIMSELDCVNHISHSAMNGVPPKQVVDLMKTEVETVAPDT
ncbi:MAG: CBS domain-containing protein, partial [Myxococcota bacterium]